MTDHTWSSVLGPLVAGQDLSQEAAAWAMERLLSGEATPAQQAAFVVALRCKGETVAEIAGLADTMLDFATPIEVPGPAVDVVGSGGDRANTVNISTMAAIVAAAAGARVVKHGNRAASSACGAADVLEELGVTLDVPPERQAEVVAEVGVGFLFAPLYHPGSAARGLAARAGHPDDLQHPDAGVGCPAEGDSAPVRRPEGAEGAAEPSRRAG